MLKRQLTPEEVIAVSLATKGESYDHRRWPEDVVRAFASAQVITEKVSQRQAAGHTRLVPDNLSRFLRDD